MANMLLPILAVLGIGAVVVASSSKKESKPPVTTKPPTGGPPLPPMPPLPPGLPPGIPPGYIPPIPGIPGTPPITTPPVSGVPAGFPIPAGLPDNGVAGLPDPGRGMVVAAMTSGSPDQLDSLAAALTAVGQTKAGAEVSAVATAKRLGIPSTAGTGAPSTAGISVGRSMEQIKSDVHRSGEVGNMSPLSKQWTYIVEPGDTPGAIALKIVGDERRFIELITTNPQKKTNGLMYPEISFAELVKGERLFLPKTWNKVIDEEGRYNGMGMILPSPDQPAPSVGPARA